MDTYLRCSHCKARLAHVNFLATAVLYALALLLLYWVVQWWGANHSVASARRVAVAAAIALFMLIAAIRLGLVWMLWWLKQPSPPKKSKS